MRTIRDYWDHAATLVEYQLNLVGVTTRDEDGAVSTEMALVIAALVAIAVTASVIFMAIVRDNANAIPDNVPPPTPEQADSDLPRFSSPQPVRYVLEINAGEAAANIQVGDLVAFAGSLKDRFGC